MQNLKPGTRIYCPVEWEDDDLPKTTFPVGWYTQQEQNHDLFVLSGPERLVPSEAWKDTEYVIHSRELVNFDLNKEFNDNLEKLLNDE